MRFSPFPLLAALISTVLADVEFTQPAAGATVTGGGSIVIQWKDSGDAPALSDLSTYQLFLCVGGNDEATIIPLLPITDRGNFANGNKAEGTIPANLGASTPNNAYFLKMISVGTTGGTITNYSDRFSMSGMTGVMPAAALQGLKSVSGTAGPAKVNAISANQAGAGAVVGAPGDFSIAFWKQTGSVRYAAMQTYPGTKITKKSKTPLNPTSPYVLATTFLAPQVTIQTTVTQSITWSFSQQENPITPAAQPTTDPMQRFLNRWKD